MARGLEVADCLGGLVLLIFLDEFIILTKSTTQRKERTTMPVMDILAYCIYITTTTMAQFVRFVRFLFFFFLTNKFLRDFLQIRIICNSAWYSTFVPFR